MLYDFGNLGKPQCRWLTASAKDKIAEGIKAADGEVELLHINEYSIERCHTCGDGWGLCSSEGRCVIFDDFATAYDKMKAADGIIFVTPVYWHDLAESLKSFLDRLRRCETAHNHMLRDKKCMLIACAGGSGYGAIPCLEHLEATLCHMGMRAIERLPIIQFNKGYMLPALIGAGEAFAIHLRNDNILSKTSQVRPRFIDIGLANSESDESRCLESKVSGFHFFLLAAYVC